jgi:hypothetical protein
MEAKKINGVHDLIGIAKPNTISDFMELTPVKRVAT